MSSRYHDHNKGSSRSTRDDSRTYGREDNDRDRHRSRSPRSGSSKHSRDRTRSRSPGRHLDRAEKYHDKSNDWESDDEVPAPPPPPRISKISIGFSKPNAPIKMNLGGASKTKPVKPKPTVASVFNNDDDDDEPEEMPAEAKMRMRNIGRETPTSAGPNSFGKTKQGFCDSKKVFEKSLKQAMESEEKPVAPSMLPQTIYKIKGP